MATVGRLRSTSARSSSGDKGLDVVAMVVGRRRVGLDDETVLRTHVSGKTRWCVYPTRAPNPSRETVGGPMKALWIPNQIKVNVLVKSSFLVCE